MISKSADGGGAIFEYPMAGVFVDLHSIMIVQDEPLLDIMIIDSIG